MGTPDLAAEPASPSTAGERANGRRSRGRPPARFQVRMRGILQNMVNAVGRSVFWPP